MIHKRLTVFAAFFTAVVRLWATEPLSQPSGFYSFNITAYSFSIGFTDSGADGYLVLRNTHPFTDAPVDGTSYTVGETIGTSKVFSVNADTDIEIREAYAGTTYYFAVFAYNGSGASCDYRNIAPLEDSVTTLLSGVGNYYDGVDQNSPAFLSDLKTLLHNGKAIVPYYEYGYTLVEDFFQTETGNYQKSVTCEYSNEVKTYYGNFDFTSENYSREHALPRSWMRTGGNINSSEGADCHNLYLANFSDVNQPRSNYPYGEVETVVYEYLDFKLGYNSYNELVCEPTENIKGDVARSQFYMLVCYNGTSGNWGYNNLNAYGNQQNVDVLLNWHQADPPDAKERAKHEFIFSLQHNRNPFIDRPDWTDCINFKNVTLYANCTYVLTGAENEAQPWLAEVYPNPVAETVYVSFEEMYPNTVITLYDVSGKVVYQKSPDAVSGQYIESIPVYGWNPGMYFLQITSSNYKMYQKLMIQN